MAVRSSLAVTTHVPSGLNSADTTESAWPANRTGELRSESGSSEVDASPLGGSMITPDDEGVSSVTNRGPADGSEEVGRDCDVAVDADSAQADSATPNRMSAMEVKWRNGFTRDDLPLYIGAWDRNVCPIIPLLNGAHWMPEYCLPCSKYTGYRQNVYYYGERRRHRTVREREYVHHFVHFART